MFDGMFDFWPRLSCGSFDIVWCILRSLLCAGQAPSASSCRYGTCSPHICRGSTLYETEPLVAVCPGWRWRRPSGLCRVCARQPQHCKDPHWWVTNWGIRDAAMAWFVCVAGVEVPWAKAVYLLHRLSSRYEALVGQHEAVQDWKSEAPETVQDWESEAPVLIGGAMRGVCDTPWIGAACWLKALPWQCGQGCFL